jgi:serine/threonine protein kinase
VIPAGLTRLDSDRVPDACTYLPAVYGDRFWVRRLLASAGQGYVLLVEDAWSCGPAVLKGLWWQQAELDNPRRGIPKLHERNSEVMSGLKATRQAVQLTQQAPAIVDVLPEPAPALLAAGVPDPPEEWFVVQQFVGHGLDAAATLAEEILRRAGTNQRFTEAELLDLADQLGNALAALHRPRRAHRGARTTYWIHGDVKPENILVLGPPWRYVLIDYDSAVEVGEEIRVTTTKYAPPAAAGTPDRHPERHRADQRFDIYMLGMTLAEAAGLRRLDDDVRDHLYRGDRTAHRQATGRIADLGYDPIITSVIVACLSALRVADVGKVQNDLGRARQSSALRRALLR